jgi:hypothetical protein
LLSALRHSIKHLNDLPPLATGLKHVHETCRLGLDTEVLKISVMTQLR